MRKRIVSLLLSMGMVVSMCLSGCANTEQEESKTSESSEVGNSVAESEVESAEEEFQLEEATIQLWLGGPGKQKDSDEVWEKFNEMLQEYVPNTTVEFNVMTTAEYGTQFDQMLAAGEEVDLAWIGGNWVTGKTNDHIDNGDLMPIKDLLYEYGSDIVDVLGQNVIDKHTYKDGEIYYLPSWQGLTKGKYGIYVIKEIAELCGGQAWYEETQELVTHWWNEEPTAENFQKVFDQFDKYLAAAKEADMLYAGATKSNLLMQNYHRNTQNAIATEWVGPQRMDDTFTVVDAIQTDHYKVFAQTMADFYKKGYIRSDIASADVSQFHFIKDGVYDENTNIVFMDYYVTDTQYKNKEKDAGVELYAISIEEKGYLGLGDATAMAIPYCADEPERAMMVLEAIYSVPELYQLLIYGIEGKHYTDNGDGTITTSYGAEGTSDCDYGLWRWTIGTCLNSLVTQADTPGYYQELAENDSKSDVRVWDDWSFDKTEVQDVLAVLAALRAEYEPILENGYMGDDWIEVYDKLVEERKAAGLDRLIEEYDKQLQEYLKEKNITSW